MNLYPTVPNALIQKWHSAYYCWVNHPSGIEHYMMSDGIKTRHSSKDEVIKLCNSYNAKHGLPTITR